MKNIVVGIDFSQNSENALRHAVAIGLRSNAKIHIVWVKTPTAATKLDVEDEDEMMKKAHVKLDEFVAHARMEAPKNEIQGVILEGKAYLKLTQYAANIPDALLVVGSHGASGFEEMFIGSNTMKVVGLTKVPVLIIGSHVKANRDLTKILTPIDMSFETLQKMKMATECARYFSAKVHILGLCEPGSAEVKHAINVQVNHAKNICDAAAVRCAASTIDIHGNTPDAVVEWAKNEDVNLIVVMREEEDDISAFWLGSHTRQMMNLAPMPLMVIPNVNHSSVDI
ncbi:MAG: universal stress protein [Bacteroidales bacterium]|nr:universal stress protein [Bacteroidales bacterium]